MVFVEEGQKRRDLENLERRIHEDISNKIIFKAPHDPKCLGKRIADHIKIPATVITLDQVADDSQVVMPAYLDSPIAAVKNTSSTFISLKGIAFGMTRGL